jgi:hypothetical protein
VKDACTVHFLDPDGNRSEIWPIGSDGVPADVHARLKDDQGDVYALVVYENGLPQTTFLKKEVWKHLERQFAEIERGASGG